jgi:peptide/nickel transport system substrate-binding protein
VARRIGLAALGVVLLSWLTPGTGAGAGEPLTLRLGITDLAFTDNFDPTGEYVALGWALDSNLLLRTLLTYRHVAGANGTTLVPDLATHIPQPTDGGLTYTFHLKAGIRFGPPLDRPISSRDIAYAFERINARPLYAQYGYYYEGVIQGMNGNALRPEPIPGIDTPNRRTIVFHLVKPASDFPERLTLPATAPVPREVAHCFPRAGGYGGFVISSGPYMLAGSPSLDLSQGCPGLRPLSGFLPGARMVFVRNPDYDPATDSPEDRENLVDRVRITVVPDPNELFARVDQGELDAALEDPPPDVLLAWESDPDHASRIHPNSRDVTWYITMNLTIPPFDDVHVRRAVNWALDKAAIGRAWGGPVGGDVATHVVPPMVTGGHPTGAEYDPYATPGEAGDVARARAEMAKSRYDPDRDGRCDASACQSVLLINRNVSPWTVAQPYVVRALAAVGITARVRRLDTATAYTYLETVERGIPIAMMPGWIKDYPDPFTFMHFLFDSRQIVCYGNVNYSLVGATPAIKRRCNAPGRYRNLPSVDANIDRCEAMALGTDRTNCWVALDHRLMEHVVPWVPMIWPNVIRLVARSVTRYEFDQFSGEMAFSHVTVDPSKQAP